MATKIVKNIDKIEVCYDNNPTPFFEFWVSEDNKLVMQEPTIEDDLTTFFAEISVEDWVAIKTFVDRKLNR